MPASETGRPEGGAPRGGYPALRSFMVLRKERNGGYLFNPYLPPEQRLDPLRFEIASMCDGTNRVVDIAEALSRTLGHSREYIDFVVRDALDGFTRDLFVHWRPSPSPRPAEQARDLGIDNGPLDHASAPLFVIWELTSACNLKCRHCLAEGGAPSERELSTDEVKGLLDQMERMKVFMVDLSGGEPLMRPDIHDILAHASKKRLAIDLLSNGHLIDDGTARRLEGTNIFHVQLSLDGTRATHDGFRGIPGSFDRVLEAAATLRRHGIGVSVSTTITRKNQHELEDLIRVLIEAGIASFKTTLFMPSGRGRSSKEEYQLSPADARQFTLKLSELKERVGDRIDMADEELYPWLLHPERPREPFQGCLPGRVGCTAGNSSIYITADGMVTPCPFLRDFPAGDVRKQGLSEIWHGGGILPALRNLKKGDLKGKCASCEYLGSSCIGGCRAAAHAASGDLYGEDPICWKGT